jgi:hypothetical protein
MNTSSGQGQLWEDYLDILFCLKGLSHEIFGPVFWPVWIYLGLGSFNFKESSLILDSYLSIDAFHAKPSRRFVESPRRIDN